MFLRIALTALVAVLLKDVSVFCMCAVDSGAVSPGVLSVDKAFAEPKTLQAVCSLLSADRHWSRLFETRFNCKTQTIVRDDGGIIIAKENMVQRRRSDGVYVFPCNKNLGSIG